MTTFVNIKNKKIIINIVALISIFFFSFHFYPKINFYNKFDYKGIKTFSHLIFFSSKNTADKDTLIIYAENLNRRDPDFLSNNKIEFLDQYMKYLKTKPNIIADAPCPNELKANNLRNVQIYFENENYNSLDENDKKSNEFNVRFNFYKFSKNSGNLEINKCFDYIFKENLNKYYLIYRNLTIQLIEDQLNLRKESFLFANENNLAEKNYILTSNLIKDIELGKIVFVKLFENNEIEATYTNGTNVLAYFPDKSLLISKLSSKNVDYSHVYQISKSTDIIKKRIYEDVLKAEVLNENMISIMKKSNFFIDPNVNYTFEKQKDKNSSKIILFAISLLMLVSINIAYKKMNRKKISKFINQFINT